LKDFRLLAYAKLLGAKMAAACLQCALLAAAAVFPKDYVVIFLFFGVSVTGDLGFWVKKKKLSDTQHPNKIWTPSSSISHGNDQRRLIFVLSPSTAPQDTRRLKAMNQKNITPTVPTLRWTATL
jgi:hypothetical protein